MLIETRTLGKIDVVNTKGSKLGHIYELILDVPEGKIAFVIISFGGIYGFGKRLSAIPWRLLRYNDSYNRYTLKIESNALYTAPGFDNNSWPETNDPHWYKAIEEFYRDKESP